MEISFCSHPSTNKVIATEFGTWYDSWAVVACAKFWCDMINCNWIRAKWIFHRIWIVIEKSLVKWVPDPRPQSRSVRKYFVLVILPMKYDTCGMIYETPSLVKVMAWRLTWNSHYLNQWWSIAAMHICGTRVQCVYGHGINHVNILILP